MGNKKLSHGYHFTYEYPGIARALITPAQIESAKNKQGRVEIRALWDTGATNSLISREIATQLNLQPVAKTYISTPSDKKIQSNVYIVDLHLPNNTTFPNLRVIEGVLNGSDMLIGMDVISTGDFVVSNFDRKTTFTFRMPSLMKFDFSKHSYVDPIRNESPKIGRNDPCPCGSGKKYKQCCGK